jgi:Rieske 2Fe-2S family protein
MTTISLPASLLPTLSGQSYVDVGYSAREREQLFEPMWFRTGRASEIAEAGQLHTGHMGRESILVGRAGGGAVPASALRSPAR